MTGGTLKLVYDAYFHFVMLCRQTVWGNLTDSNEIFNMPYQIITVMKGVKKVCGKKLFRQFAYSGCYHLLWKTWKILEKFRCT
jgi:hypothetical protein